MSARASFQMRHRLPAAGAVVAAAVALALPNLSGADSPQPPVANPAVPAARDAEPMILTGSDFPGWSAPSNVTFKLPLTDLRYCTPQFDPSSGSQLPFSSPDCDQHNGYSPPDFDSQQYAPQQGVPVDKLLGYRWDPASKSFKQIPFQVDEVFTRYLTNPASGFAIYSGDDQHTTYAFDREGFRYTGDNGPNSSDPCTATPKSAAMKDPVQGLDNNDELTFMASDAGPAAPAGTALPTGIAGARQVEVQDPSNPSAPPTYAYVMLSTDAGPKPAYSASNGYVKYVREAKAGWYAFSQSSYADYGNAAKGYYCDDSGHVVLDSNGKPKIGQRRPRDWATVSTPRYQFHYGGRWLMDDLRISGSDDGSYGPNVLDRWKARAFAQDPGSKTPCCGFEEEENNWGGSSILLGEKVGPVRAIRETWGADSGTNVIRRETFYRDQIRQKTWLRVHPIPPLDGIYSQWDFRADRMTKFYTPKSSLRYPNGIAIDGKNDEAYGNVDDPCNPRYDPGNNPNGTSPVDQQYRSFYRSVGFCQFPGFSSNFHASIDQPDLTISDANAALSWSLTSGPFGSVVDRYQIDKFSDLTPGGAPQSLLAVPYYRDDSCFDDGTGADPGPHLQPRHEDPFPSNRKCWDSSRDGDPNGNAKYYQGSIGTHGLHLLMVAESDNARQTVPVDEIVAEQRLVMLPHSVSPGDAYTAGEQYGRGFEKPLIAILTPYLAGLELPSGAPLPCIPLPAVGTCTTTGSGRPSGATSAPATKPNRLHVAAITRRILRAAHGRFSVRCRIAGNNLKGCMVRVYRGRQLLATGFTRSRGGTVSVRLRLNNSGHHLLARHPRGLRVKLVLVAVPTSGIGLSTSRTVTVRQ